MPRKTVKRKLFELLYTDTQVGLVMSQNEVEFDRELDIFLENVEWFESSRYICKRYKQPKSTDWYINVLPNLDDFRFRCQLRVTRNQFQHILNLIQKHPVFHSSKWSQFPVEMQLAIALYRFGHTGIGSSYANIGSKFGVGDGGTIKNCTNRVIEAILSLREASIYWPDHQERQELEQELETLLPGCIGYVDGTHINLEEKPSVKVPDDYYSRKQRYGLHLQVIVDSNLKFRHIKLGRPASSHDAKVFSECELATDPRKYFSKGQFIVGDAAYRLTEYLITPFRSNSNVGTFSERKVFNYRLSSNRVKVENAIGILKEKFSSLKELRVRILDRKTHVMACQWIEVCCIIHNLTRSTDDQKFYNIFNLIEEEKANGTIYWGANDIQGEVKRRILLHFVTNR